MTQEKLGPHEDERPPSKEIADEVLALLDGATREARHLPVVCLELTNRLPGSLWLKGPIDTVESIVRRILRDEVGQAESMAALYPAIGEEATAAVTTPPDVDSSLTGILHEMLENSVLQSPKQAKEAYFKQKLLQLVPDEVRILAALSDDSPHALISIGSGPPGSVKDVVLKYASTVGADAGVRWLERTPDYISHLKSLDLVVIGPRPMTNRCGKSTRCWKRIAW